LKIENPDIVVTFNKEGESRHPDHIKISKTATLAFEQYLRNAVKHVRLYYTANPRKLVREMRKAGFSYTAFGKIKGTPDSQITTVIDVSETMPVKIKAIKCHRTQNKDWERFLKRREMFKIDKEYFRLILENKFV
ncbi:MAG: hypothetical protein Q7K55_08440, partial [Candidatus Levybacteria bacterium]|nr:hypothetical protein [Candidatus Levybacteria bacterium]